jgi:hypothetical protein
MSKFRRPIRKRWLQRGCTRRRFEPESCLRSRDSRAVVDAEVSTSARLDAASSHCTSSTNLGVAPSLGDELEDLGLAWRQALARAVHAPAMPAHTPVMACEVGQQEVEHGAISLAEVTLSAVELEPRSTPISSVEPHAKTGHPRLAGERTPDRGRDGGTRTARVRAISIYKRVMCFDPRSARARSWLRPCSSPILASSAKACGVSEGQLSRSVQASDSRNWELRMRGGRAFSRDRLLRSPSGAPLTLAPGALQYSTRVTRTRNAMSRAAPKRPGFHRVCRLGAIAEARRCARTSTARRHFSASRSRPASCSLPNMR